MKPSIKFETTILLILISISVGALIFFYRPYMIDTDAAQCTRTAMHIIRGEGISTSLLYYEQQLGKGFPAPQTVWPLGFPAVIALFILFGASIGYAAFIAAFVFQIAGFILLYLILEECDVASGIKIIAIFLWAAFIPQYIYTLKGYSESTYIFFCLLSFIFFIRGIKSVNFETPSMITAGLFAGGAFLIRYSGITLIFSYFVYFLGLFLITKDKAWLRRGLLIEMLPGITVAAVFTRNILLSGSYTGGPVVQQGTEFYDVLKTMLLSALKLIGINSRSNKVNGVIIIIGLIWIVIWLSLMFHGFYKKKRIKSISIDIKNIDLKKNHRSKIGIFILIFLPCVINIIANFGLNIFLGLATSSNILSPRYLLPIIPFSLIAIVSVTNRAIYTEGEIKRKISLYLISMLGAVFIAGQAFYLKKDIYKMNKWDNACIIYDALKSQVKGSTLGDQIKEMTNDGSAIMEADGQWLGHFLDRPAIGLAPPEFTKRIWDENEVKKLIQQYNVSLICIFPKLLTNDMKRYKNRVFLLELDKRKIPQWLSLVYENDAYLIFKVNKEKI